VLITGIKNTAVIDISPLAEKQERKILQKMHSNASNVQDYCTAPTRARQQS
jgi:hypothetical protein